MRRRTWTRVLSAGLAAVLLPFDLLTHAELMGGDFDPLNFVDPLIGTLNGGHVFPGATLPLGMAKAVADVNTEDQGGFASDDGDITGFSHMHDSGTGGSPSLGNFPIFPQTGCAGDELNNCFFTESLRAVKRINGTVAARPGYFALTLNTTIRAEMTVSNHTALYRFTFPTNDTTLPLSPLILADLNDLPKSRMNASISVDDQGRIVGSGHFNPSFGVGQYELHFCADFDGADLRDSGVFMNNRAGSQPKSLKVYPDGINNPPLPAGAWVQFHSPRKDGQILVRVGLSFISTKKACQNAEREIGGFDFDGTRSRAEQAWRDKLKVIQINSTGVNETFQRVFWSGVYRTMISPQDYTGENPLWESDEPYYDSFYCIWDSYRSSHPLLTILDPQSQTLMIRSLIDIYRHEGWLPDCRMSLCKGFTQGGSNANVVLVDSYLKGITDGVDWNTGYQAVVKDAEEEPSIWTIEGRGGLHSWKDLHYIPADDFDPYGVGPFTRSISRTVEYAYNDFCIALLARALNHSSDFQTYATRSTYWRNLFDGASTSTLNLTFPGGWSLTDSSFRGFLQPRYLNGTFGYQDPSLCQPLNNFTSCYLNPDGHETYEGGSWLYTFYAPHDMASLISLLGGREEFVRRLRFLHDTPDLLYIGDEQAFLLVFLFHYAGRPGLSSLYAHKYIPSQFNDTLAGIPGNDDSGAMGSFAVWAMMGLWPVSGQDVYLITPAFFAEVSVRNGATGKLATIRCVNFDAAYANLYVQSVKLNGEDYRRNWITHRFFLEGGVLELTLGADESHWGTAEADVPPSTSTRPEWGTMPLL